MWIMLNDAFFSIVHKDCRRDELLVRARRAGDIEKVFQTVRGGVRRDERADYLYRAVVKAADVRQALAAEVARITYGNFKDSVQDEALHDAYLKVWHAMATLQPATAGSWFGGAPAKDKPKKRGKK